MPDEKFPTGKVEDEGEAWIAAHAEKGDRDDAREKGTSMIEKIEHDQMAEKKGEKIIDDINIEKEREAVSGEETINGVKIKVQWDRTSRSYVVSLSEIDVDTARSHDITEQSARITKNPSRAKLILGYIRQSAAKKDADAYKIFKSAADFSKNWDKNDQE